MNVTHLGMDANTICTDGIPPELVSRDQWVLWKLEDGRKVPYSVGGFRAKSNKPTTWSSYDRVVETYSHSQEYVGIGYVFSGDDPFLGVDFDGCRDPATGELSNWAAPWITRLGGYCEISPSGTGVKMFLVGASPLETGRKVAVNEASSSEGKSAAVEMYDHGRFFTVTGWRLDGTPDHIAPPRDPQALQDFVATYFAPKTERTPSSGASSEDRQRLVDRCRKYIAKMEPAISGQGGHDRCFAAACVCFRFGLTDDEAANVMHEFNGSCEPPWSDRELEHKLNDARRRVTQDSQFGDLARQERQQTLTQASGGGAGQSQQPNEWPDPKPLPGLSPVEPFDFAMLPESLRDFVHDIAERMQCPPDFPAVSSVLSVSVLVGRRISIRPKRRDDWTVVPNLWGAIVGRPSLLKTPALNEPLNIVKRLEIEAKRVFDEQVKERQAEELVERARSKQRDKDIEAALKRGEDAHAIALEYLSDCQEPPRRTRYLISDTTIEKLGEILAENPNGVLLFRDELVGFLKSLDREGNEGARAFYLESWNGNGRYTFDRIGRGTLDIESTCVSILGGIQPGPLSQYVRECQRGGRGDDGLLQRFQLLVWPDVSKEWRNVDRWPDTQARQRAYTAFERLAALDPPSIGCATDDDGSPYLRFDTDAQSIFDQWRSVLERRLRDGIEHDALVAHLAKYRSLVPTLALLFHLIDGGTCEVSCPATERAIQWATYLESHARRLYGATVDAGRGPAIALAGKIKSGDIQDGFSLRDVYRSGWANLDTLEDAKAATELLADLNWLSVTEDKPATGRPSVRFAVNPKVKKSGDAQTSN